jgi:hydroxyacylglutathione hydrolase
MILKQFYLACLSHASYLIADKKSKTAAVVDPQRDVAQYLAFAKKNGVKIRHVILTHFHADFVSGHLELAAEGAQIYLGRAAKADYPFVPLGDGDALEFGSARLEILETPGHTPEAICVLVKEKGRTKAVLTGDTLFVGDVGRPDLMASKGVSAKALAGKLYDSLRGKLLALPDETLVYPAHGAGSMCGKALGPENHSTIGAERRGNYALKPMPKAKFIALVSDQPAAPKYFGYDAELNRRRRDTLDARLKAVKRLSIKEALALTAKGAQLLDSRDPAEFEAAHIPGSVNVGLGGRFASWAGMVLDVEKPLIIAAAPGREKETALRLGRIGFDRILGFVSPASASPAASIERIEAEGLARELASKNPPLVLDVRGIGERANGLIEPSLHIPLPDLPKRWREVPKAKRLVIHCAGGYRSAIAASILAAKGRTGLVDLVGGYAAWTEVNDRSTPAKTA